MGFPVLFVFLLSSLLSLYWVQSQDLREQDALCREDGCFVIHFQRKIFLDAWRSCKEQDGNLAIIRNSRDAEMVEELFANVELRPNHRGKANIWIGLQRQPRQCSPNRQLRGFSWVTGDQDTEFTNWLQEDSSGACSTPRCVVMPYNTAADEKGDNLKWKDGPCSISVDGYLCWYNFRGMCKAIGSEGGGNTFYSTPFNLLSTVLTYVPFGSVATVPCPAKEDQSVLCTQKDDGAVAWNRDPPFCSNTPKTSLCDQDNGGCHHICIETSLHYYCDCSVGYLLAEDGASCFPSDPCNDAPCEFECLPVMDGYRCACPDGYMLAPDERSCVDVDECLQSPCEHICENSPGTFECHCRDGYRQDQEGACEDVDECADNPCEHACENTIGSHICHCHLGFAPLEEDQSRCHDIDECQIEGTCEQMCINYLGGFECYCEEGYNLQPDQYACRPVEDDFELATTPVFSPFVTDSPVWEPEHSEKPWQFPSESDWRIPLSWTTQLPSVETVQTDPTWSYEEEPDTTTQSPEIINVDTNPEQPVHSSIFAPTIPLSTPDYYEDESTTVPPDPPSSTALGGAWNWLWFSSVQPETQETANRPLDFPGDDDSYDPDYVSNQWYNDKPTTFGPDLQTSTLQSQAVQEVLLNDENTSGENHGTSWLLVGLLVPLCIFVVVMVVLGIIYCTRYTVKPQEKTTSDCYHWIAGAGDKAAADISGPKTNV